MLEFLLHFSSIRPPIRMERILREHFTEGLLGELHALSNRLMAEDLEHFRVHAQANDLVYVFRRTDTGAIVGFQFWRTAPMKLPRSRIILGGKLRILPEFRRHGLHLLAGLDFFLVNALLHPLTRHYRLSIPSIFGFVSITEALAHYELFDPKALGEEGQAIRDAFQMLAEQSHFRMDPETGLFFVDIYMTPETLSRYPPAFFEKPGARRYASVNPDYRTNGSYVGMWFRFTPANLLSVTRTVARRLRRSRASG
ncbi:hypothetical protein [Hyalangium versicolor]|uniref:hypothetical protein n=1 Tax=Hyalangium versicolor TaxID=2861190 RepID=UPI001CCD37B8|nr:hypothetical protein [Hyalangium versicolor]